MVWFDSKGLEILFSKCPHIASFELANFEIYFLFCFANSETFDTWKLRISMDNFRLRRRKSDISNGEYEGNL